MECLMRTRVKAMVEQLAREHQQEPAAAGTLVDLEELAVEIGDEVESTKEVGLGNWCGVRAATLDSRGPFRDET